MPPLPVPAPKAVWPEIDEKKRDLHVDRSASASAASPVAAAGGAGSPTVAPAGGAGDAAASTTSTALVEGKGDIIDPAVWHCGLLNRLEIRIPGLSLVSPLIGHLGALQTLILANNALTELPETLAACGELKFLDISNNQLAALPAAIGKLPKLESLNAAGNKLSSLAPLATTTSLVSLLVDRNELTDLAGLNFPSLSRLEVLSVSYNKLTELPEEVGALGEGNSLTVLDVSNNALTALPSGLSELKEKRLKEVRLMPNPFADKKMLKIINGDRPEKLVKELWKYLADNATGKGGKKGKGKGR